MPFHYLKITDDERNHIAYLCKKQRLDQKSKLDVIKEKLFGDRDKASSMEDKERQDELAKQFYQSFNTIYSDSHSWLDICFQKIEERFESKL